MDQFLKRIVFKFSNKNMYKVVIILLCSTSICILDLFDLLFYFLKQLYFVSGVAHDISKPGVDTNDTVEQFQSSRFVNQEPQFSSSRWLSKDSFPACESK